MIDGSSSHPENDGTPLTNEQAEALHHLDVELAKSGFKNTSPSA